MPSLQLTQLASDLDAPLGIYFAPGNSSRGYIILARGEILLLDGGNLSESPFLDISDRIQREEATYEERGLLGMAFHPDFPTNGKFFLHYTSGGADDGNGQNVISEFTVSGDPNVADAGSERVLLTVPQPNDNHNGGSLAIGLDGNLYIGVGDGGFEGVPTADAHGNGQNANTLLSAILRIGLDGSIPAGNMAGAAPEIWDIGIRNPWRMSFDGCTGDLYIGDVGFEGESASTEEIDVEPPLMGGRNYGWPIMEGEYCRDAGCDMSGFVLPTDSYAWDAGGAVIGGYVYRGSAIPGLRGTYIYADFQSAEFYAFEYAGGVAGNSREISSDLNPNGFSTGTIVSFGQDPSGEMYVIAWSGGDEMNRTRGDIYRIDPE
jgi:glucose/arabinose dehydrogenase